MMVSHRIARLAQVAAEAAAETLWPTRCAICDAPGQVLCERCAGQLPFVDWWRSCRRCGSPLGFAQCDYCDSEGCIRADAQPLPFRGCASAVAFTADTGQIVRVLKDQGEQRLAAVMAACMARVVPPSWDFEAVTYIPASSASFRNRGFDHAELIAGSLAGLLDVPLAHVLDRPLTIDQRGLSEQERKANLAGSFSAVRPECARTSYLVVDDVFTTGATLCAASSALKSAGAADLYGLTFARACNAS